MTLNCKSHLLSIESPLIMGILNITEDSFFDGGCYTSDDAILRRAEQILSEGGNIIDLGAVSTRPGAKDIDEYTEILQIKRALNLLLPRFSDAVISVDTWRASVAKCAVEYGASIINDISGGTFDDKMMETVGELKVPYILMHTTAKPSDMQSRKVQDPVLSNILQFFGRQLAGFREKGCKDIILDPGFGFGKSIDQNYFILKNLETFKILNCPILVGISRKSMIYKILNKTPQESLTGTIVLNTIALLKGADILRVHDVKEAVEVATLMHNLI